MKFRVWDNKENKYVGESICDNDIYMIAVDGKLYKFDRKLRDFVPFSDDRYVVEMSTGLKDKNGVEIYEGDTITSNGYPWIDEGKPNYVADVEWIFAGFEYVKRCINPDKRGISNGINETLEEGKYFEVIGNIHEAKQWIYR